MNQTAGSFVRRALGRLRPDPYILALLGMVVLASLLPARGEAAVGLGWATKLAIALLFFLHGAKLSREAVIAGIAHWRLHLTVLASTFVLFPILGLGVMLLPETILPRQLALGVLFLCCLPSTVQSSIAFTAIARGNVAAAVLQDGAAKVTGGIAAERGIDEQRIAAVYIHRAAMMANLVAAECR